MDLINALIDGCKCSVLLARKELELTRKAKLIKQFEEELAKSIKQTNRAFSFWPPMQRTITPSDNRILIETFKKAGVDLSRAQKKALKEVYAKNVSVQ